MNYRKGIKISLVGTACTGKTTLLNALASVYPEFKIQNESVRYIKKKYGIDFKSGDTGLQLAVLELQTRFSSNEYDYLLDRGPVDSYSYTKYYRNLNNSDMPANVYQFLQDESKRNAIENIDLFIFLRPGEFPVVEDGTRITDPQYLTDVDRIMEETIKEWGVEDKTIQPHGSIIERVEFCKPYIDKLIEERK